MDGSGTGVTTVVDGSTSGYILGQSIADGSMEVARWLDERQAQQFDAIYVAPGAEVAMHITEQIEIDYDPNGRKTNYAALAEGVVDEILLTIMPFVSGEHNTAAFADGPKHLGDPFLELDLLSSEPVSTGELFLHYRIRSVE